jgi:uncharacterized protein (TIGR02246 family)
MRIGLSVILALLVLGNAVWTALITEWIGNRRPSPHRSPVNGALRTAEEERHQAKDQSVPTEAVAPSAETKPTFSWERISEHARGSLIAVSFGGVYPPGSAGAELAKAMIGSLQSVLDERTAGVIIDLTSLDYVWGDTICGLAMPLTEKKRICPAAIVAKGRTAEALRPLFQPNVLLGIAGVKLFRTRQEAIAYFEQALGQPAGQKRDGEESIPAWSQLISLPHWMPLADFGWPIVSISDRLYEVGTNAFLETATHGADGRPFAIGPRIVRAHWAPSRAAVQRIVGRPEDDDGAWGTPPAELIPKGALPQYESIFAALRSSDAEGLEAVPHRTAQNGKVIYRVIKTDQFWFYFRGDGDSEPPFRISVLFYRPDDDVLASRAATALINAMVDAWNRGDAGGFASMFAPHAEYVTSQGEHVWGREAIAELVRKPAPGSQVVVVGEPFVEGDRKAVKARFSWATADQGAAGRSGVTKCALIRQETRWMVEYLWNYEPRQRE